MSGKFITVEGVEGVGKSTNIETIKDFLHSKKIDFITTREPGGTVLAEEIRELLLKVRDEKMCELTELLLMFAARAQHVEDLIKPALKKGTWVLCDRFTDATYAYQGAGRSLNKKTIESLENLAQGTLRPDLTIILDLDPEIGLQRASKRGELDRFEKEEIDFFNRVRSEYQEIAQREPNRCKIIDASVPLEKVKENLLAVLENEIHS